jgi:hypothetical protein
MKLIELEPKFLHIVDEKTSEETDDINRAQGIIFLCPKCFHGDRRGVHSIICWAIGVPLERSPGPGRWALAGTGYEDLSLVAGSSSVLLTSGCRAHFFVRNGEIVMS